MNETIKGPRNNKFLTLKEALGSKCMKVNLGKTKVMVSRGTTKDGLSKNKVDSSGVCSLIVKANSILSIQCSK